MATTTVLIAYKITDKGAQIVGEYSFAMVGDGHEAKQAANQALAAAAARLESEFDILSQRVVLFDSKSAEHNAERLAAARANLIDHFAPHA